MVEHQDARHCCCARLKGKRGYWVRWHVCNVVSVQLSGMGHTVRPCVKSCMQMKGVKRRLGVVSMGMQSKDIRLACD